MHGVWTKNLGKDDRQDSEDVGLGSKNSSDGLKGRSLWDATECMHS